MTPAEQPRRVPEQWSGPERPSPPLAAEPEEWDTPRPLLPELALVAATVAFGATFAIVQDALDDTTPVGFIFLRFSVGAVVLAPFAWRRARTMLTAESAPRAGFAHAAALLGIVGFLGYAFQNAGLEHTSTSVSAFLTGLFVVFTPLAEAAHHRRPPAGHVLLAVAGSVVGLFLLTGAELTLGRGEALTLVCALFFGLWIYIGGLFVLRFDPLVLNTAQMMVFAAIATPVVVVEGLGRVTAEVVVAVLVTGVLASAVAFSLQLWGQRRVEPSRAAVILLLEPLVAAGVGYAIGERLGVLGVAGAAVILASILVAESGAWRRRSRSGVAPDAP